MNTPTAPSTRILAATDRRPDLVGPTLATLLASLGTSVVNVALPAMASTFDASFGAIQWIIITYLLVLTVFSVGAGWMGDRFGRQRLLAAGIGLYTAAALICGLAPWLGLLLAGRAAQGLGAAVMVVMGMACVVDGVPDGKAGHAVGLLGTMSAVGTAMGPSLGGVLVAALGWRSVFLVTVPLGMVALLTAIRVAPDSGKSDPGKIDRSGLVLLAATLAFYALAVTVNRSGWLSIGFLLGSAAGLALFVWNESRVSTPLIRVSLLRIAGLGTPMVTNALVSSVVMTTLVVGPFYLSAGLRLPPAAIGLAVSVGPVVAALVGIPAGRHVDHLGARPMALAGLLGVFLGSGLLAVLPSGSGVLGYLVPLGLATAGYALFQTANTTQVMTAVSGVPRGVLSGLLNLSRNLGLITGASVMAAVFSGVASVVGESASASAAASAGMRVSFALGSLLALVAWRIQRCPWGSEN